MKVFYTFSELFNFTGDTPNHRITNSESEIDSHVFLRRKKYASPRSLISSKMRALLLKTAPVQLSSESVVCVIFLISIYIYFFPLFYQAGGVLDVLAITATNPVETGTPPIWKWEDYFRISKWGGFREAKSDEVFSLYM